MITARTIMIAFYHNKRTEEEQDIHGTVKTVDHTIKHGLMLHYFGYGVSQMRLA